jgi:hypothetical protein
MLLFLITKSGNKRVSKLRSIKDCTEIIESTFILYVSNTQFKITVRENRTQTRQVHTYHP